MLGQIWNKFWNSTGAKGREGGLDLKPEPEPEPVCRHDWESLEYKSTIQIARQFESENEDLRILKGTIRITDPCTGRDEDTRSFRILYKDHYIRFSNKKYACIPQTSYLTNFSEINNCSISRKVCLECGECRDNIELFKEMIRKGMKNIEERIAESKRRKELAEKLWENCKGD
jgi:hypothetical protein